MKAINLLPPDLRGASSGAVRKTATDEPGGIGAFVVLGALAACVLALAAYVLTSNMVKDRQAKLETVTAQTENATQRADQLKPYADFKAMAETRIQTVKDLASSRFDWEQALRDVSRAIPANVTLTSLNGTIADGASAGGSAGGSSSSVRSAIAAPAIQLNGCTRTQEDVATLLSRLRNVDGVTRVSLGKSLKPAPTATAPGAVGQAQTAAGATGATTATPCGNGRPPTFELVMFFEGSEVPASVQDLTVQPSAPAGQEAAPGANPSGTDQSGSATAPPVDSAEGDPVVTGPTDASAPQGGGAG
jgi:Tfp pilus assembly protein PilN